VLSIFAVFAIIYLAQSLLYAPSAQAMEKYQVSVAQIKLLTLAVALPYVLIWVISAFAYRNLWRYNTKISGHKDGDSFQWLTLGVLLLTLWLPISAVVARFTSQYYTNHPDAIEVMVRINNYTNLALLLSAYTLLFVGAKKLTALNKEKIHFLPKSLVGIYAVFSAWYIYLVLNDAARSTAVRAVEAATYYLPDPLIILTLVIPRLLMWLLGLAAVYKIYQYKKYVKGTLYKEALARFALGLGWIVAATIVLRLFQTIPIRVSHLNLGAVVAIVYLLLLLLGVGYALLLQGTKRLKRLEEV
jgi:hypothetical protein